VVGQDVDAGDDDPVVEVEQQAHEGLDGQVVDGAADALKGHDEADELDDVSHGSPLASGPLMAHRPSGASGPTAVAARGAAADGSTGWGDLGMVGGPRPLVAAPGR
jgi:hypothetical protein